MSKRISKRVRDATADYCAVLASTPYAWSWPYEDCFASQFSFDLWWIAYSTVRNARNSDGGGREWAAEAESLLRCGWSPGDEP